MPFKIVETIERGKSVLTTVPECWENKGVLRWPKFKNEKLRRNPRSIPESNWQNIHCILKRQNILSFEEAEAELRSMSDVSDTDQEATHIMSRKPQTKYDFNKLAHTYCEAQAQIHRPPHASKPRLYPSNFFPSAGESSETILSKSPIMEPDISEYIIFNNNSELEAEQPVVQAHSDILITHTRDAIGEELQEQQVSMTNTDISIPSTKDLCTKLTTLETKLDKFIAESSKNQIIITMNQQQIMQTLSEISIQFDEFIKHSTVSHLTQTDDINKGIKKICNEESLTELEELLKNKQDADEMTKIYSVLCGRGKGRGMNNAYALSDAMFDRKFLNQCSWAGGSRGHTSKICSKTYKRTIDFFFKIIHASDSQFTILECESFFKNILRNSKKRCESKMLKRSAQKNRPTKQQTNRLENKENEDEENYQYLKLQRETAQF